MLEKIIIGIAIFVSIAAVTMMFFYRRHTKHILQNLDRMLDRAIDGTFTADTLDETMYSAVENKLSRYLADSELSARNVEQEKEKIKTLIADISHQTKHRYLRRQLKQFAVREASRRRAVSMV